MPISNFQKGEIITHHKNGMTNTKIASILNIHVNTVSLWINRYYDNCIETKKSSGRTGKLTLQNVFYITNYILNNKCSIVDFVNNNIFNIQISKSTIRNILVQTKNRYGKCISKPLLSSMHKIDRVIWCMKYKHFDWQKVYFSDEMTIFKDINTSKCWYRKGNKKIKYFNKHSLKFNIWGMINSIGNFYFFVFKTNLNSDLYEEILFSNLFPLYEKDYYFQQDNSPIHKTKNIRQFFNDYNIKIINWPSYSPDLNLIENLWAIIKKKISNDNSLTNNNFLDKLEIYLKDIPKQIIINLYKTMSVRVQMVIDNNGDPIKY